MTLKDKILKSDFVKKINSLNFYFNQGRTQVGKFTSLSGEISLLILIFTQVLKIDLNAHIALFFSVIVVGLGLLTIAGYFYTKTGLLEVEAHVNARKNPVQEIMLDSALKVLRSKKL
jgi:hypothetical protein